MTKARISIIRWTLGLVLPAVCLGLACGDDGEESADTTASCERYCKKANACFGAGACSCEEGANDLDQDSCDVSKAKMNACVEAFEGTSCTDLKAGKFPEECNLCAEDAESDDDNDADDDATADDDDEGNDDDGTGGESASSDDDVPEPSASGTGDNCEELADCCEEISANNGKAGCVQLADANQDSLCATTLSGYRAAGLCN